MAQELEIEFKNLLTKKEYDHLIQAFNIADQEPFHQVNHYFETSDLKLKANQSALRIRQKENKWVLTLKEPHPDGLLETNETLDQKDAEVWLKNGFGPSNEVKARLSDMEVDLEQLHYLGELETERLEKEIPNGLLVLDKNQYLGVIDYELEFEVPQKEQGLKDFEQLLSKYKILKQKTSNKIERFYTQLTK
ncbi:CYTH domain-containing protein [Bacillaceae bacterium S4-13-58]